MPFKALIFDVDGVIAETEADGHRVAFNKVFEEESIEAIWDLATYGKLLQIAGGKERMKSVIYNSSFKEDVGDKEKYIKKLHKRKTAIFQELVEQGLLPPRKGVKRLIKEANEKGIKLAIGTTSDINAATTLLQKALGEEILRYFDVILAGDIVKTKKPDPEIYNLAAKTLGFIGKECAVIEDMLIGLKAAKAAGMKCIITRSYYSKDENFEGADLAVDSLGEPGDEIVVDIERIKQLF